MLFGKKYLKIFLFVGAAILYNALLAYSERIFLVKSDLGFVMNALRLVNNYIIDGSSGVVRRGGNLYVCTLLYVSVLILAVFSKGMAAHNKEYSSFIDYVVIVTLFTFGAFNQYEMYVRFSMFIIPFFVVIVMLLMSRMHGKHILKIAGKTKMQVIAYFPIFSLFLVSIMFFFLYASIYKYAPVTDCFHM